MNKKLLVNLGSGPSGIKGWDNLDWGLLPLINKFPIIPKILCNFGLLNKNYLVVWPKIRLCDITKKLPYKDNSVDFVYCSHVLEHFDKWQTLNILRESNRIMKKDGVMRIVLPDLEKVFEVYRKEGPNEFCRVMWGFEKDVSPSSFINLIQRRFIRLHQWMYDKKSFEDVVKSVGFKKIKWVDCKKGEMLDIKKLDLEVHKELSMYVEIKK